MRQRLNKAFKYSPATNQGIFYYLQQLDIPWKEKNISTQLDYFYHLNRSGNKITSPLIDSFMDSNCEIASTDIQELANIIYSLFGQTWSRMWDVYNAEYNPLNNYDMTETLEKTVETTYGKLQTRTDDLLETQTNDLTETRRGNQSETRTDDLTETLTHDTTETRTDDLLATKRINNSETRTDDLTITETPEQTKTTLESVYGFNSVEGQPSREVNETNGGQFTKTQEGTVTTENENTETLENDGTVTNAKEGTETTTKEGTVTTENENTETLENDGTVTRENTGTQEIQDSGTDTEETGHTLTRYGNIGVTTSQQMLQSEIALWEWNFFKSVVFPNVDGVLTIALY